MPCQTSTIILIVVAILGLLLFGIILSFFSVWLRAWLAGAYVGFTDLIAMRLRQVPYGMVVDARITAKKAGIDINIDDIEAHFLAGGNVIPTIQALIAAQKAGITLDWNRACAIDLATKGSGKSVVEAVRTSVDPKVIDCPNPASGRTTIDGVAKDGIQVKVRARVTVRTNLDRFVGGAKEETIIARVGEGIVTTIGSAETYKTVLESRTAFPSRAHRGLDVGTAFEILSIDIADVDVGENVGAQAPGSAGRGEQEHGPGPGGNPPRRRRRARTGNDRPRRGNEGQGRRGRGPGAARLAEAFRSGNLGVMDYYKMENIKSDTQMRGGIGRGRADLRSQANQAGPRRENESPQEPPRSRPDPPRHHPARDPRPARRATVKDIRDWKLEMVDAALRRAPMSNAPSPNVHSPHFSSRRSSVMPSRISKTEQRRWARAARWSGSSSEVINS
jgi:uncharacterized protein YqfA (UPF0365 family)